MKRSEKEQIIASVKEKVLRSQGMFFADFTGITVEQVNELRREFRKSHIDYKVAKNTLIRKALESVSGYDAVYDKLVGHTAIAFAYDDPVAPAKIIKKFRDKNQKLELKVCVIEKQVFEGSRLDEIAKMATRPEIMACVIGSLQSPIAGVIGTIGAVIQNLVSVVDAIEKKKAA